MSNFVYFGYFQTKQSFVWLLTALLIFISSYFMTSKAQLDMSSGEKIVSVDFEVFGKVQGLLRNINQNNIVALMCNFSSRGIFSKEQEAKRLGLKGWCMNTKQNTVKGVIEGLPSSVSQMKLWLQKTGSPSSRIDKAVFANEKDIREHTYDNFKIKR